MSEPEQSTATGPDREAALDRIAKIDPARSWTITPPLRPWELYGRGTLPVAYRRVRDEVQIVGAVCGGLRAAPVITLPEDLRPPGWTTHPVAVGGVAGIATAIIDTAGRLTISTDSWSGGQTHYDLGLIVFPVSEQLSKVIEAAAARIAKRLIRTENRNGAIVRLP